MIAAEIDLVDAATGASDSAAIREAMERMTHASAEDETHIPRERGFDSTDELPFEPMRPTDPGLPLTHDAHPQTSTNPPEAQQENDDPHPTREREPDY